MTYELLIVRPNKIERFCNSGPQDGDERNMEARENYISGSDGRDALADDIHVARKE